MIRYHQYSDIPELNKRCCSHPALDSGTCKKLVRLKEVQVANLQKTGSDSSQIIWLLIEAPALALALEGAGP